MPAAHVRARHKKAGLCVNCGGAPPITPLERCGKCVFKASVYDRRYYARNAVRLARAKKAQYYNKRARGLCVDCGQPRTEYDIDKGFRRCVSCRDHHHDFDG